MKLVRQFRTPMREARFSGSAWWTPSIGTEWRRRAALLHARVSVPRCVAALPRRRAALPRRRAALPRRLAALPRRRAALPRRRVSTAATPRSTAATPRDSATRPVHTCRDAAPHCRDDARCYIFRTRRHSSLDFRPRRTWLCCHKPKDLAREPDAGLGAPVEVGG